MKKLISCIIILVSLNILSAYFDTEYSLIDSISYEWQNAGFQGEELPDFAHTINANVGDDIQQKIDDARDYSIDHGNCIVRVELAAGEYSLNNNLRLKSLKRGK